MKIFNLKFGPIGYKSHNEIIGIEFGSNTLKVVFIRETAAKKEIVKLISTNISGLAENEIIKFLNLSLHSVPFSRPIIVDVITPNLVITKNIEIPSINPDEIRQIVKLQAARHTPYAKEEIIVDYIDLGIYKQHYTKILLIIVAKNTIKKHFEMVEKAGFNLDKVCFSAEAITSYVVEKTKIAEQQPLVFLNIDDVFSDFIVVAKNKPVFIRSIPLGMQVFLLNKEQSFSRFTEEIKKSLEAYQIEDIEKTPKQLFLSCGNLISKELQNTLSETLYFSINPINYLENFSFDSSVSKIISSSEKISYLNVILTAFKFRSLKVNILPDEVKLKKSFEEKSKELIKSGIFLLISFVLFVSILVVKIYYKTFYLKELQKVHSILLKDAKKLENDYNKVRLVRNYIINRGYSLEILAEIYNSLPEEIEISEIRLDNKGRLVIRGTADAMSNVFSFLDKLSKIKYFKEVKTKYTTKRKEGAVDVTDFEINAQTIKETTEITK